MSPMTPEQLEQQALAAGASPAAAAAARAFVEALPADAVPPAECERDDDGDYWMCWSDWVRVCACDGFVMMLIPVLHDAEWLWRPGQPIPPRVRELIARVAT